jgi:hypothetical protein
LRLMIGSTGFGDVRFPAKADVVWARRKVR